MTQTIIHQNHKVKIYMEGTGEPLLFLHGWPTNSKLWKAQVDFLKPDYKVITLDWLGFGQSDKPLNYHYTFESKKDTLSTILSHLLQQEEKITIIAHDVGGPPAILWASENQTRVKRLVLLNTIIYPFKTTLDKIGHFIFKLPGLGNLQVSNFGLKRLTQNLLRSNNSDSGDRVNEILHWHKNYNSRLRLKTILEPADDSGKNVLKQLAPEFSNLKTAKFLVIAREDPLCFRHMQQLQAENPQVPVYIMDQCGHYIPIDQPEQLNQALKDIMNRNSE